jgi:peptide/nickel transport system substrate-binding protein
VSYTQGQEAVVRRYDGYVPRDEPANGLGGSKVAYADEIVFVVMPDANVRVLALDTGDIDFVHPYPASEFDRVEQEGKLATGSSPGTDWGAIYFNFSQPPFDDLRMRQAVAYATDYQKLADALFWGRGEANNSFIPRTQVVWRTPYHDTLHPYDPDRARELLEEYGYDGSPITTIASNTDVSSTLNQTFQSVLKEIGLNLEIQVMESAAYSDAQYARSDGKTPEWPLIATFGSTFRIDPDQHYYQRVHSSTHIGMYNNPDYDAIVEEARSITDTEKRIQLYEGAQRIVMEDMPAIVTINSQYLVAYSKRLQGVVPVDPVALYPILWNVWIEE